MRPLEYQRRTRKPNYRPLRLVVGLLFVSVPLVLACFSIVAWKRQSMAIVMPMILAAYTGFPCIALGAAILPREMRRRIMSWCAVPLIVCFVIIFKLGSSAEIS